jgi:hypothetical protein
MTGGADISAGGVFRQWPAREARPQAEQWRHETFGICVEAVNDEVSGAGRARRSPSRQINFSDLMRPCEFLLGRVMNMYSANACTDMIGQPRGPILA